MTLHGADKETIELTPMQAIDLLADGMIEKHPDRGVEHVRMDAWRVRATVTWDEIHGRLRS